MKIVHVETGRHLYGGPQQVLYLCNGLANRGIDTTLVCAADSELSTAAQTMGLNVINLPCAGDLDLRFAWRLRQILRRQRPDIVHCHSRRGADFLGGQAAAMEGIPAVVSRRVDNSEPALMSSLRYRPFQKVIAISEAIANVLLNAGLSRSRLLVIRSAVDVERFSGEPDDAKFCHAFRVSPDNFVMAAAGQFIPRKGHRYLLNAVAALKPDYPQLRLVIFGQGPLENELRLHSSELGLGDTVQFAGFRDDLDDYLGCFDLLVHPALKEGLGVIALKASAAGVPVVGFDAGGLAEVVVNQETGILVPVGDVQQLQEAIGMMVDDTVLRTQYAHGAAARMREKFSIAQMVEQHVSMYESILNA